MLGNITSLRQQVLCWSDIIPTKGNIHTTLRVKILPRISNLETYLMVLCIFIKQRWEILLNLWLRITPEFRIGGVRGVLSGSQPINHSTFTYFIYTPYSICLEICCITFIDYIQEMIRSCDIWQNSFLKTFEDNIIVKILDLCI